MTSGPQLFRVTPGSTESERVEEVEFADLGLREQQDIEDWVAANPSILGEELVIVSRQFRGFDRTRERPDLLAVDSNGKLVLVELKRDDSGADVHWQAIKYASYFRHATASDVVGMLAEYSTVSVEDAENQLLEHLDADDLATLNSDQRIVLASHRFAPEVTSAVLWLNAQTAKGNLISCVTLTPYRDGNTGSLYIQAATIIPVPGVENLLVRIGPGTGTVSTRGRPRADNQNITDEITAFTKNVSELTHRKLLPENRPDRISRWAGGSARRRYCHLWYSRPPWSARKLCYTLELRPREANMWRAGVWFRDRNALLTMEGLQFHENQTRYKNGIFAETGVGALDEGFADQIATTLATFIEQFTPIVDGLEEEGTLEEDEFDTAEEEDDDLKT